MGAGAGVAGQGAFGTRAVPQRELSLDRTLGVRPGRVSRKTVVVSAEHHGPVLEPRGRAAALAPAGRFHLLVNAAGLLHGPGFQPEKKLGDLHQAQLLATFTANAIGPALLLRHFSPLLDRQRALLAMLSAKVGSIEDNRLGGWYSYRASKAALNMLLKTAAIECRRSRPQAVLVALHPGTVSSALSQPFRGDQIGRPADQAAAELLAVIDGLTPADTGRFIAYDGAALPW